jgi:pyrroline-5-carboxylate reductase
MTAFIGVGNIGRILLERLTTGGIPAANLILCDGDALRAEEASRHFGPRACSLTDEPLPRSDIFLLTAPPECVGRVLLRATCGAGARGEHQLC